MNFHFPKNKPAFFAHNQKGSLLILVLCALMVLSLLALSTGYTVHQKLNVVGRLEARENLRLAAAAAVQQASLLINEKIGAMNYQTLNQQWANSGIWKNAHVGKVTYSIMAHGEPDAEGAIYGLTDEDRKINLNKAKPQVLQILFENAAHLDRESARRLAAAIQDWRDEDKDITDGGAESNDYLKLKPPYAAKNSVFNDLNELKWVQGVTPEIFEKVKPFLTLDGTTINLNTTSQTVLIVMGLNPNIAGKIISFRQGKDEKEGTEDDGIFKDLGQAVTTLSRELYLNDADREYLASVFASGFAVKSAFFNAEVIAQVDQRQKIKVNAIFNSEGQIQRWHEEFF